MSHTGPMLSLGCRLKPLDTWVCDGKLSDTGQLEALRVTPWLSPRLTFLGACASPLLSVRHHLTLHYVVWGGGPLGFQDVPPLSYYPAMGASLGSVWPLGKMINIFLTCLKPCIFYWAHEETVLKSLLRIGELVLTVILFRLFSAKLKVNSRVSCLRCFYQYTSFYVIPIKITKNHYPRVYK